MLTIKDDETGLEFKTRIQKEISELLGRQVECRTYEEAYYDG